MQIIDGKIIFGDSQYKKKVVISDIHIGLDLPTVWYRKEIHEPYLAHVLKMIIDNKDYIDELIILGDLLDFWTYPPHIEPPTTQAIIDDNPTILGKDGLLAQVASVIQVSYLNGNHDITLQQDDLNLISPQIRLQHDPYIVRTGGGSHPTDWLLTHGHRFTLFNAPNMRDDKLIPLGHFVTRMVSYDLDRRNLQASHLKNFGAAGMSLDDLKYLAEAVIDDGRNIAEVLMERFMEKTKMPSDLENKLTKNKTTTIEQVIEQYHTLWDDWVNHFGLEADGTINKEKGRSYAINALVADNAGAYMPWWTMRESMLVSNKMNKK